MVFSVGVDVGSRSVRAVAVSAAGDVVAEATREVAVHSPAPDHFEQSSDEIWAAVVHCIQALGSSVTLKDCVGVGFAATCSLVVLDEEGRPQPLGDGKASLDTLMWMDHRAKAQATAINATQHPRLRFVGGSISLEAQPPKLVWLKENKDAEWWTKAGHFLDLPDFLTFRATGELTRSQCSVVCKWLYDAEKDQWDDDFWRAAGLEDLCDNDHAKIGRKVVRPGTLIGKVSPAFAAASGLPLGMAVGASLIDAHAGVLGALAALGPADSDAAALAIVAGTSTCHMALSTEAHFVPGVWGPYKDVLGLPGVWLNEGGQSAVGSVLDQLVQEAGADLFPEGASLGQRHRAVLQRLEKVWLNEGGQSAVGSVLDQLVQEAGADLFPEGASLGQRHRAVLQRLEKVWLNEGGQSAVGSVLDQLVQEAGADLFPEGASLGQRHRAVLQRLEKVWLNEGGQSAVGSVLDQLVQEAGADLFPEGASLGQRHRAVLQRLEKVWLNEGGQSAVGSVLDQLVQEAGADLFPEGASLGQRHRAVLQRLEKVWLNEGGQSAVGSVLDQLVQEAGADLFPEGASLGQRHRAVLQRLEKVWLNEGGQSAVGSVLDQLVQEAGADLFPEGASLGQRHRAVLQRLEKVWLNEGGQSAVGSVLDQLVQEAGADLFPEGASLGQRHRVVLQRLEKERLDVAGDVHVWPDYHGNRSPRAEERLRGAVIGLSLYDAADPDARMAHLAKLFLAHVEALALQTREIWEAMAAEGLAPRRVLLCGGLRRNALYVQAHADALQLPVILPESSETVALGAALLGTAAAKAVTPQHVLQELKTPSREVRPDPTRKDYFDKKMSVYRQLGQLIGQVYATETK